MQINPLPTEQTTAVTDLLLMLATLGALLHLRRFPAWRGWRRGLWLTVLVSLGLGAGLAAPAHGLLLPASLQGHLWSLIYLALGTAVSAIAVAALHDLKGPGPAGRLARAMGVLVLLLLMVVKLMDDEFLPFVLYEGLALSFALALYGRLAWVEGRRDARWLAAGILVTLLAAALQALHLGAFVWIWSFDHNGTFHLIQLLGMGFILLGLRVALRRG